MCFLHHTNFRYIRIIKKAGLFIKYWRSYICKIKNWNLIIPCIILIRFAWQIVTLYAKIKSRKQCEREVIYNVQLSKSAEFLPLSYEETLGLSEHFVSDGISYDPFLWAENTNNTLLIRKAHMVATQAILKITITTTIYCQGICFPLW